ncbi:MAG: hypothetical protein HQK50_12445 [Oligoflexia bacterium]|nr:hypothetical protein [Oligoflexia bacterium]MBF0366376.1 hypothetical protein [Oligoflexia bacterium]
MNAKKILSPLLLLLISIYSSTTFAVASTDIEALAHRFAQKFTAQYGSINLLLEHFSLEDTRVCRDLNYSSRIILSLRERGRFHECLEVANRCKREHPQSASTSELGRIWTEGALCAQNSYQWIQSKYYFNLAISDLFKKSSSYLDSLYQYHKFLLLYYTGSDQRSLLSTVEQAYPLPLKETELIKSILNYLINGDIFNPQWEQFIAKISLQIQDRLFLDAIIGDYLLALARNHQDDSKALQSIDEYLGHLLLPSSWYWGAYLALYRQDRNHFTHADQIYKEVSKHLHSKSDFPVEHNPFTYTQIATTICKDNFFTNGDAGMKEFSRLKQQWALGEISINEAIDRSMQANKIFPHHSDLLTFIGSLLISKSDASRALEYFWSAHQACPYNNRAHRGIEVILKKRYYRTFSNFQQRIDEAQRVVDALPYVENYSKYILNWNLLSPLARTRLKYASSFYARHIDAMYTAGMRLYVKDIHQYLSETPLNEDLRDQRIQGGDYEGDNRLWDDVRGSGGNVAVVDLYEMMGSVFGEYNLVAHEMGHQLHDAVLPTELKSCIRKLYLKAKAENRIPNSYTARNELEYFAQGITYYLNSDGLYSRRGPSKEWLKINDPLFFQILSTIENVPDFNQTPCPL